MRILVSFLAALALLTMQSIRVEAQSDCAKTNCTITPDDPPADPPADDKLGKDHCVDEVEVSRTCYDYDGPGYIEVKVNNCNPYGKDWIAIYDDDVDYSEVGYDKGYGYWGDSYDWTFLCGDRECDHPVSFTYLYFYDWWDNELLVNGHYKIYLFRDNGFRVDAESESFQIKNTYHYCDYDDHPSPTHPPVHPTPHPVHPTHHPTAHPNPTPHPVHPTHHPTAHPDPTPHPVHPTPHPVHPTHHPTAHPDPTHHPTPHPTPSNKPVEPAPVPTLFPTFSPTGFCPQDSTEKFTLWNSGKEKKCKWAGKKINKVEKRCNQRTTESGVKVKDECPRTCKACGSSSD